MKVGAIVNNINAELKSNIHPHARAIGNMIFDGYSLPLLISSSSSSLSRHYHHC